MANKYGLKSFTNLKYKSKALCLSKLFNHAALKMAQERVTTLY